MTGLQSELIASAYGLRDRATVVREGPHDGAELRRRRERVGLSIAEASRRAGLSETTWAHAEEGRVAPRKRTLAQMRAVLTEAESGLRVKAPDGQPERSPRARNGTTGAHDTDEMLRILRSYLDGLEHSPDELRSFFVHSAEYMARRTRP